VKELASKKIDYYEGCPPFSNNELEKKHEKDDTDDDYGFPWSGGD
jgi:hypothetical protein